MEGWIHDPTFYLVILTYLYAPVIETDNGLGIEKHDSEAQIFFCYEAYQLKKSLLL